MTGIIAPPTECDCGGPAHLVLLEVYTEGGRTRVGAFSQFGKVKGRKHRHRILDPRYRYKRWIAQCLRCISVKAVG